MKKYKVYLSGGHKKTIMAKSALDAENKYYNSLSHFNTEYDVERVELCKGGR